MDNTSYPYQPKSGLAFAVIVFFGFCSALTAYLAMHNQTGLLINKLLYLSSQGATFFYWLLSFFSALFILAMIWLLIQSMGNKRSILLTSQSITAPKRGPSKELITIPYQDITSISVDEISGTRLLKIVSRRQQIIIPDSMLNHDDFERLIHDLTERFHLAKQKQI